MLTNIFMGFFSSHVNLSFIKGGNSKEIRRVEEKLLFFLLLSL